MSETTKISSADFLDAINARIDASIAKNIEPINKSLETVLKANNDIEYFDSFRQVASKVKLANFDSKDVKNSFSQLVSHVSDTLPKLKPLVDSVSAKGNDYNNMIAIIKSVTDSYNFAETNPDKKGETVNINTPAEGIKAQDADVEEYIKNKDAFQKWKEEKKANDEAEMNMKKANDMSKEQMTKKDMGSNDSVSPLTLEHKNHLRELGFEQKTIGSFDTRFDITIISVFANIKWRRRRGKVTH
ncbi:MAG: hypothetical protein QM538_07360 [Methylacidiphilales bacterium]|nr:hypothetical protein [Candidatus Methylacidiphilales bacterium]